MWSRTAGCGAAASRFTTQEPRIGLFLVDRTNLPLAVITAMRAHAVRRLGLVALRAQAGGGRRQRVVRAALRRPRLRVSAFGIRHDLSTILSSTVSAAPAAGRPRRRGSRTTR